MSSPTTTNSAADVLNGVISALMSGGVTAAETYLTGIAPEVMAIPILAWLADEGISYLAQVLTVAGEKFADQIVVNIQTNGEKADVLNTATALAIAIASKNASAISAATIAASAAYKSAFNFDGWATTA